MFQSDRKNNDGDNEVQDPLKEAVKQIINDEALKEKFEDIANKVKSELQDVAERTLDKVEEMSPGIAKSLKPVIPETEKLKWADVFKNVSITGEEDIPINKRGSGVKRLILLNFFRAEAERRKEQEKIPSIIYAIEEPETSQHTEHQKKLIKALLELSKADNTQIIITTHSAVLVKELKFEHLRLIKLDSTTKTIENVSQNTLSYPSLNEVNFLAFSEITEEYHNELYGYIKYKGKMKEYRKGETKMPYTKLNNNNKIISNEKVVLTDYIRHQIHHPENKHNKKYTPQQLEKSIGLMRDFIIKHIRNNN